MGADEAGAEEEVRRQEPAGPVRPARQPEPVQHDLLQEHDSVRPEGRADQRFLEGRGEGGTEYNVTGIVLE